MLRRVRPRSRGTESRAETGDRGSTSTSHSSSTVSSADNHAHSTFDPGSLVENRSEPGRGADDKRLDDPSVLDDRSASRVLLGRPGIYTDDDRIESDSWPADRKEAPRARAGYAFSKRATDITVSLGLIVFLAPLLVAIAVLIKLDSSGPVLFRQERFGRSGKSFRMTKFRTMVLDAPDRVAEVIARAERGEIAVVEAPAFKSKDDPRVTRVGKYLRRFSLDELPQLLDVLSGSMSLVGPRPLVASETQALSEAERVRHLVKPGLTCIWQTSRRSRVSYEERLAMDIEYTRRMSFWLDLALLLRTPLAVFRGDGAY